MSTFTGIREASRVLRQYLSTSFVADPQLNLLFGVNHLVTLSSPVEMRTAVPTEQGLSVWLYLVAREATLSNRPDVRVSDTLTRRAPLPMTLHYLLTPVDDDPENEQLILGKVLALLHDHTTFPVDPARPDLTEVLRLSLEVLDLESITRVWNALDAPYELSVSYRAQVVDIESGEVPRAVAPVLERVLDDAQIVGTR